MACTAPSSTRMPQQMSKSSQLHPLYYSSITVKCLQHSAAAVQTLSGFDAAHAHPPLAHLPPNATCVHGPATRLEFSTTSMQLRSGRCHNCC